MTFKITRRHPPGTTLPEPPPAVSRGLGDTVAKITHSTGIAQAMQWFGMSCRCPERQEAMNKAVPYGQK